MTDWISVKDRLPEKTGSYLVFRNIGYGKQFFSIGIRLFYEQAPEAFTMDKSVTHWMPLPDPPEEVTP